MSNSILTKNETKILMFMISFLRNRGSNQLADRCERVFNNAKLGVLTRSQVATSVIREAAFRAILLACRESNGVYVRDFSMFVLPHLEKSFILDSEARKLEDSNLCMVPDKKEFEKPVCSDHHNCPGWIQGFGCDICDYRPV